MNGQPGAIFRDRDGKVVNTWTLDVLDGRIQAIRAVLNPDKLGHLGPVADAYEVLREANQARHPDSVRPLRDAGAVILAQAMQRTRHPRLPRTEHPQV